jgi:hypothetical protein
MLHIPIDIFRSRISTLHTPIDGSSMDDRHTFMCPLLLQDLMELLAKNPMLFFYVHDAGSNAMG